MGSVVLFFLWLISLLASTFLFPPYGPWRAGFFIAAASFITLAIIPWGLVFTYGILSTLPSMFTDGFKLKEFLGLLFILIVIGAITFASIPAPFGGAITLTRVLTTGAETETGIQCTDIQKRAAPEQRHTRIYFETNLTLSDSRRTSIEFNEERIHDPNDPVSKMPNLCDTGKPFTVVYYGFDDNKPIDDSAIAEIIPE